MLNTQKDYATNFMSFSTGNCTLKTVRYILQINTLNLNASDRSLTARKCHIGDRMTDFINVTRPNKLYHTKQFLLTCHLLVQ